MFWLNYGNVKTLALAWQVLYDWLLGKFDRINRMITLSVFTLSGFHCIMKLRLKRKKIKL